MKPLLRWPVLWWLRFWARLVLKRVNPMIIGVTGSAGKTSAIEAIRCVASLKFKNLKVAEKANSESGIPADILGLHFVDYSFFDWIRICFLAPFFSTYSLLRTPDSLFDCYAVELGVDEPAPPKNMGYLLTILQPYIGVILNALPVHTQQFGEQLGLTDQKEIISAIAREKGKLITENSKLQTAILNADQPEIANLANSARKTRTIIFGRSKSADVVIDSVRSSLEGTLMNFRLQTTDYRLLLSGSVLPDFYGYTFASALCVGLALGIDPKSACDTISKNFKLPPGRGQIFRGINNTTIIDSSYNASRETMIGSLKLLKSVVGSRKAIGILGDMRELGNQAAIEHEAVARVAAETLDEAILVGPLMKQYALPILVNQKIPVHWFQTAGDAARFLLEVSQTSSAVILVKGSQNTIFLEIVVEALLSDKSDISKLCRRGKYWDKQRVPYR